MILIKMHPKFTKINTKYDVGPDHEMLYVHIIVPKDRSGELRTKLNRLLDWFMSRNKIWGINTKTVKKLEPIEYEPKVTNGKRGRPRLTIDNDGNVAEVEDDDSLTD